MAETIPDIIITKQDWVDLNTLSGLSIGSAFTVSNKGTESIWLYEGTTAPNSTSTDGEVLHVSGVRSTATIEAGSLKIWARAAGRDSIVVVQEV